MEAQAVLDSMVPISEFSHGGAGRTFSRVVDGCPVFVLKHNRPAAVIVSPDDYRRMSEAVADLALYQEAVARLEADDGTRYTMDEVFGSGEPADPDYEPEFE